MESTQPKNFIARLKGDASRRGEYNKTLQVYASGVDFAIIVMTVDNPKFSSMVLDKYLVICEYGDVKPIIVLNKVDLAADIPEILDHYRDALYIPVFMTSAVSGKGIAELKVTIAGKTVVFLGKSGVGKSSLINSLKGSEELATAHVSEKYGEGRHTTTAITKYSLGDNTFVIDTPGLRNLDLSNLNGLLLRELFVDFVPLQPDCKFRDCIHVKEVGCAVKSAVDAGTIAREI